MNMDMDNMITCAAHRITRMGTKEYNENKRENHGNMSSASTEAGHASLIRTAIHHFSTSRKFVQSGRELTRLPAALSLPYPSTTLNVTAKRLCMFAHVCIRTTIYPSIYLRSAHYRQEVNPKCCSSVQTGRSLSNWVYFVYSECS